jgi:lipoprotein-anchoring transpeptidase ErfK/SrfK
MSKTHIDIDIQNQTLCLWEERLQIKTYAISTGFLGVGESKGSFKTPRGLHYIRAKIGAHALENSVFVARRPTGEIYHPELKQQFQDRDWILTRILWLCGLEIGKNRLGQCDTFSRYIYIHGTPDEAKMGVPGSHGCIRMHNKEVIDLFNRVPVGTRVLIRE